MGGSRRCGTALQVIQTGKRACPLSLDSLPPRAEVGLGLACDDRTCAAWVAQPRFRAISAGRRSRLDASKLWLRRRGKASDERNPASLPARSAGLKARTYMGAFMPSFYQTSPPLQNTFFDSAQSLNVLAPSF